MARRQAKKGVPSCLAVVGPFGVGATMPERDGKAFAWRVVGVWIDAEDGCRTVPSAGYDSRARERASDSWDFLRHFRPLDLMEALEPAPELRKDILVAAGLHEKIARRKSPESAAESAHRPGRGHHDRSRRARPAQGRRFGALSEPRRSCSPSPSRTVSIPDRRAAGNTRRASIVSSSLSRARSRRSSSPSRKSPRASESKPSCTGFP